LSGSGDSGGTAKQIVRKASKISFGTGRKDKDRGGGDASVNGSTPKEKEKEKDLPGRPSGSGGGPAFGVTQSSSSSSFFDVQSKYSYSPPIRCIGNVGPAIHTLSSSKNTRSILPTCVTIIVAPQINLRFSKHKL